MGNYFFSDEESISSENDDDFIWLQESDADSESDTQSDLSYIIIRGAEPKKFPRTQKIIIL